MKEKGGGFIGIFKEGGVGGVRPPPPVRPRKGRRKRGGREKEGREERRRGGRKLIGDSWRYSINQHIGCFKISKIFWRRLTDPPSPSSPVRSIWICPREVFNVIPWTYGLIYHSTYNLIQISIRRTEAKRFFFRKILELHHAVISIFEVSTKLRDKV